MEASDKAESKVRYNYWAKPVLFLVAIVVLAVASYALPIADWLHAFLARVDKLGPVAPFVLGIAYIVACVLFVPGLILTLGAGFLFGVVEGTIVVSISSTLGSTVAFLVGRYFARDMISRRIARNQKFKALDEAVAREGWRIVGLIRLCPIFPFNVVNYIFGLTRISLKEYLLATWIGMLPGTILYVYIGSVAGDLATLSAGGAGRSLAEWVLYGVGLIATILVVVYVTRLARKAVNESIGESDVEDGGEAS